MPFTLTMPKLSPTMEEGTIAKWHKKVGDFVDEGDLLIEVATDKATVEYNAIDKGYLRQQLVKEGEEAVVNQAIAIFTEKADESIEGYTPEGIKQAAPAEAVHQIKEESKEEAAPTKPAAAKAAVGTMQQPEFIPVAPLEDYTFERPEIEPGERLKASPLARKIAKEQGLDLATVKGSGPGGRIVKADLERAQPLGDFAFGRREYPTETPGSYDEEALTPMRKVISRRLQESKTFVPHFYVNQTVDAGALVALREQLANLGLKVSFNDCIVRACALALRKHPGVNSGFNSVNNSIIHFKTIDVAVAVTLPTGLITPIIRHTDYKNLGEISQEIKSLAARAKAGKLETQEYQGGSFTVSNLGMYGVTDFAAIINPPQSCILAVGGIADTPIVKNGQVIPGKTMNITLSVDHRVVDGALAAEYIRTVKFYLENPACLIL